MTEKNRQHPRAVAAPIVEELDPRILFSADVEALAPGVDALLGGNAGQAAAMVASAAAGATQEQAQQAGAGAQAVQARVELVFVDMSVPEAQELVSMLQAQAEGERSFEIIEIDPAQDGLEQITRALAGRHDIAAVHVVSHGDASGLQLGSTRLDAQALAARAGEVVGWSDALSADADLLLYGCDLASGAAGMALVDDLAMLTGADVAASTDRTGSAMLGADWVLEYRRGNIEAAVVADAATQAAWQGALATVTFQEGVGGYTGTADTYLSKAAPSTSYGSSTSLIVDDGTPNDMNVLISFANLFGNGAGQIPTGSTITSATLTIYVTNHDAADSVEIYRMLSAWSEASTYNSMSGGVSPDGSEASSSVLYSLDAGGSGTQTFTGLASVVQAWAGGAANYGFLIATGSSASDDYTFVSSEGATASQRPLLTVTYTPPQAPVLDLDANNSSGATGTGFNRSWTENGGAVTVADSDASLTDSDSTNLTGMTVTITDASDGTAELLAATTSGTSITASYDSSTHVLTLSGTDTVAHYQQVLRTVTYNNTSEDPTGSSRSIAFVASDAYATSSTATATVAINAVNDAPVITSNGGGASASVSIAENTSAVTTVTATDAEGATLTYSISGGADASKFTINSSTGVLSFSSAPDFDNPTDTGGNNVYDVIVQVSDGSLADTQAIAVTVTAVNDNTPTITSNGGGATASVSVAENTTAVTTVTATDADLPAQTLTYSIVGGADQALFTINASTGALAFASARDRENATDANADGIYEVTVQVSDGSLTDTQAISVTVTGVNDNTPVITSNGGGATASVSVAENTTTVTTVAATDADLPAQTLTYSISGGADQALFTINASTGALSFTSGRDRENAADANGDGIYEVTVQVSDGSLTDTQAISVTVTAVNDNTPVITSNGGGATASVNVAENATAVTTVTATDADLPTQTLTYSISGGADQALFTIDASTGALSFTSGRDRENATDANGDGIYEVTVQVSDGSLTDTQAISVTVTGVNDNTPVITSDGGGASASVNVAENATAVTTITATDADLPAQTLTYSIVGGADQALFTINASTGALSFTSGRDYESATDANGDGVYVVTVQVSDGSLTDTQTISVTVTAVNDNAPVITSNGGGATASVNVAENATAVTTVTATDADLPAQTLTYSIVGGADQSLFTINASTGALSFVSGRDRENATDADADGVYEVTVQVSDGSLTDTQAISVTVTAVNDNTPVITSNGGGATASINVAENTTAVTTVTATDADLPAQTLSYSIVGGADQSLFTINASTGALSFTSGRDRESATDADADGVYEVTVQVSDGSLTDTQAISVTVTAVNDNTPTITSNGGGATAGVAVAENSTAVTTVTATDSDLPAQTLTYSIAGGADAGRFAIDSLTGALRFLAAPDYENPQDVGNNNVYDVVVRASDGVLSATQAIAVTVTAVNEAPLWTGGVLGYTVEEGRQLGVGSVQGVLVPAVDPDGDALQALLVAGPAHGSLGLNADGSFSYQADAGWSGTDSFSFVASDGSLQGGVQTVALTVTAAPAPAPAPAPGSGGEVDVPLPTPTPGADLPPQPPADTRPPQVDLPKPETASPAPPPAAGGGQQPADPGAPDEPPLAVPAPAPRTDDFLVPAAGNGRVAGYTPEYTERGVERSFTQAYWADPDEDFAVPKLQSPVLEMLKAIELFRLQGQTPAPDGPAAVASVQVDPSAWAFDPTSGSASDIQVQAVEAGGMALTAGAVWWATRVTGLLASLMSSAPAWRALDPLPILGRQREDEDGEAAAADEEDADYERRAADLFARGRQQGAANEIR